MISLQTKNLTKIFKMGESKVTALSGINLAIGKEEFVAITGSSGSGKSTLMHLLGCLDTPTEGEYFIDGENIARLSMDELAKIRNKKIGFVFQRFHLLADLSALNNVALPLLYNKHTEKEAKNKAKLFLDMVDLSDRLKHYPYQLSGGQQQRVAIARALSNDPSVILADEPTGNLDSKTGETIINLFKKLNNEKKTTIVIVTHESEIANKTKRIIELHDGQVLSDRKIV